MQFFLSSIGFTKFHIQLGDNYNYRPNNFEYDSAEIVEKIRNFKPKVDWGMIWAR